MRIGMLGSGLIGGKLGTVLGRAGHEVVFSYSRSHEKLEQLARDAGNGARPGTVREAAAHAELVVIAVHWSRLDEVLAEAGDLAGKVVVTCSLPMNADDSELVVGHTSSGAEALAAKLRGVPVVSGSAASRVRYCSASSRGALPRDGPTSCFAGTTPPPRPRSRC